MAKAKFGKKHPSNPTHSKEDETTDFRPRRTEPLTSQTRRQAEYMGSVGANVITFGVGPAGTGKTFVAAMLACNALEDKRVSRIIVTRPAIEAGENLGFLPGEIEEKFAPYLAPVRDVFERRFGKSYLANLIRNERVIALPLAYMRGHSLDSAFILLDEAQNTTPTQMKMFLTRIGEETKVIVNGDPAQKDIRGPSGLDDAIARLHGKVKGVGCVRFERGDIVRSGIVQEVVEAYDL